MSATVPDTAAGRDPDSLAHALDVVRRRWVVVALAVAACAALALVQAALSDDRYEASASVVFGSPTLSDAALQVDRGGIDPEREAATNVLIASSEEVAEAVRRELRASVPASELLEAVSVEAEENANVLLITATADSGPEAARIANAFADEYIAFKARSEVQSIRAAKSDLREQLDALPPNGSERESVEESLQRLTALGAVATGDARVIGRASPPTEPAGLGLLPLLLVGVIVGLGVGLILVFLLESVDRRVNSLEEFEREYRLPALVEVPQSAFRHMRAEEREDDLEPYRMLRSAIDFARIPRKLNVLMVTSAMPGEGKTTVAVDLAHAIALTGRPVILVELDLRRPTFAQHLDVDPRRGVTTALLGSEPVADLLQTPFPERPNLAVLSSGPLPPDPAELLGSAALNELMTDLATGVATVIVDVPPLLPVADAQVLLNDTAVDSALVVARSGVTTRDQVRRARAILDRHVVQPLGIVVTGVPAVEHQGYGAYPTAEALPAPDRDPAPSRLLR